MTNFSDVWMTEKCLSKNGYAYPLPRPALTFDSRSSLGSQTKTDWVEDWLSQKDNFIPWIHREIRPSTVSVHAKHKKHSYTPPHMPPPAPLPSRRLSIESGSTWDDTSTLYHRMLCDVGFDTSCMDSLDDCLFSSPTEAFTDACWKEATRDDERAICHAPVASSVDIDSDSDGSSEESDWPSDSASDGSRSTFTLQDSNISHTVESFTKIRPLSLRPPPTPLPSLSSHVMVREESSLLPWHCEPHFTMNDPNESVHFFPKSGRSTKSAKATGTLRRIVSSWRLRRK